MKPIIIAKDREHLKDLIEQEIKLNGYNCDLNHINVCNVVSMQALFMFSLFDGDISQWDVSNVEHMGSMFSYSKFSGDISKWNIIKTTNMMNMFSNSIFNRDISQWDVSRVTDMGGMFQNCKFNQDLSAWKPYKANILMFFNNSLAQLPYWIKYDDLKERKKVIEAYNFNKELNQELNNNQNPQKKIKI